MSRIPLATVSLLLAYAAAGQALAVETTRKADRLELVRAADATSAVPSEGGQEYPYKWQRRLLQLQLAYGQQLLGVDRAVTGSIPQD